MNVLIIDQCSGSKRCPDWFDPYDRTEIDGASLTELRERERTPTFPARTLYTGRQQQYITEAVDRLRDSGDSVDRLFISAGFGLVDESTEVPPYDVTFAGMSADEIRTRSRALAIESDLSDHLTEHHEYDVIFLPLGNDYYEAIDLEALFADVPESTIIVVFNSESAAAERSNVISIPARIDEAKAHEETVVALKGLYLRQFAANRSDGNVIDSPEDVVTYCRNSPTQQSGFGRFE